LTKLESGFAAVTKEIMKHFNKEMAETILKRILECAICKDFIIGVGVYSFTIFVFKNIFTIPSYTLLQVSSRRCSHSFCYHCATNWFKRSTDCPICRDDCYMIVKNPFIDQFIDLFVDLTFTEEEKSERSNLIQQRSISSSEVTEEDHAALLHAAVLEPSLDTSLIARIVCMINAQSLLAQIVDSDKFIQLISDDDYDLYRKLSIVDELLASFSADGKSLQSVLDTFSESLNDRYNTFPLSSS